MADGTIDYVAYSCFVRAPVFGTVEWCAAKELCEVLGAAARPNLHKCINCNLKMHQVCGRQEVDDEATCHTCVNNEISATKNDLSDVPNVQHGQDITEALLRLGDNALSPERNTDPSLTNNVTKDLRNDVVVDNHANISTISAGVELAQHRAKQNLDRLVEINAEEEAKQSGVEWKLTARNVKVKIRRVARLNEMKMPYQPYNTVGNDDENDHDEDDEVDDEDDEVDDEANESTGDGNNEISGDPSQQEPGIKLVPKSTNPHADTDNVSDKIIDTAGNRPDHIVLNR
jgi:hypothetical protein